MRRIRLLKRTLLLIVIAILGSILVTALVRYGDESETGAWMSFPETNVMSGVLLCRHYFPSMTEQAWGRVIFISSESEKGWGTATNAEAKTLDDSVVSRLVFRIMRSAVEKVLPMS